MESITRKQKKKSEPVVLVKYVQQWDFLDKPDSGAGTVANAQSPSKLGAEARGNWASGVRDNRNDGERDGGPPVSASGEQKSAQTLAKAEGADFEDKQLIDCMDSANIATPVNVVGQSASPEGDGEHHRPTSDVQTGEMSSGCHESGRPSDLNLPGTTISEDDDEAEDTLSELVTGTHEVIHERPRDDDMLFSAGSTISEEENFADMLENQRKDKSSDKSEELQPEVSAVRKPASSLFGRRVSDMLSKAELSNCDPDVCVSLLRIPSMKTCSALNRKLKQADSEWIAGFLEADGLTVLLDTVDTISSKRVSQLSDAMLLIECVACVKTIMNSKIGLEYIIDDPDYTRKLVKGTYIYQSADI